SAGFQGANSAAVPTGYPLSNALGLWNFGGLDPQGSSERRVDFFLPSCEDFSFTIKVMGTLRRTSYGSSDDFMNPGEFIDACSLPGSTTVLANQGPGAATGNLPLPFPFTLYDFT